MAPCFFTVLALILIKTCSPEDCDFQTGFHLGRVPPLKVSSRLDSLFHLFRENVPACTVSFCPQPSHQQRGKEQQRKGKESPKGDILNVMVKKQRSPSNLAQKQVSAISAELPWCPGGGERRWIRGRGVLDGEGDAGLPGL